MQPAAAELRPEPGRPVAPCRDRHAGRPGTPERLAAWCPYRDPRVDPSSRPARLAAWCQDRDPRVEPSSGQARLAAAFEIGRATGRESVGQVVDIAVVAVCTKKRKRLFRCV